MEPKRKSGAILGAMAMLPVIILVGYVIGYFGLSDRMAVLRFKDTWIRRSFSHRWQAQLYRPAAKLESWLTGYDVQADTVGDPKP